MFPYLKNYLGFQLGDEEFENIKYPYRELMGHITLKFFQMGVMIGTFGGALSALGNKEMRNLAGLQKRVTKFGSRGGVIGLVLGPVVTWGRVTNVIDHDGLYDRCYRLRHNRDQVRVDRGMAMAMVTGAGLTYMAGSGLIYGGALGCTVGVMTAAVINCKIK